MKFACHEPQLTPPLDVSLRNLPVRKNSPTPGSLPDDCLDR
jgi:hypothetical protein